MRAIVFMSIFGLLAFSGFAQSEMQTVFLDQSFQETKKPKALYIKEIKPQEDNMFEVRIFQLDKSLKMTGQYVTNGAELVEHGLFTYYHVNGAIESEGDFELGYKTGEWKRFAPDGRELAPRFYSADLGARLRLHVLSKIDN